MALSCHNHNHAHKATNGGGQVTTMDADDDTGGETGHLPNH